jgi:hypothetical protein
MCRYRAMSVSCAKCEAHLAQVSDLGILELPAYGDNGIGYHLTLKKTAVYGFESSCGLVDPVPERSGKFSESFAVVGCALCCTDIGKKISSNGFKYTTLDKEKVKFNFGDNFGDHEVQLKKSDRWARFVDRVEFKVFDRLQIEHFKEAKANERWSPLSVINTHNRSVDF